MANPRIAKVVHITVFDDSTVDVSSLGFAEGAHDDRRAEVREVGVDEAVEFVRCELGDTKMKLFGNQLAETRRVLSRALRRSR